MLSRLASTERQRDAHFFRNPTWGYTRIRGGLKGLGHDVARNTIKAILNVCVSNSQFSG